MGRSLRLIRESAYLKSIAALILISALTTTIAGWQFKAIAKAAVPGTDDLAMFFGTFNMIAGLMSLVLQLVLTGARAAHHRRRLRRSSSSRPRC